MVRKSTLLIWSILLMPWIELFLLIKIGSQWGATHVFSWIFISFILGITLLGIRPKPPQASQDFEQTYKMLQAVLKNSIAKFAAILLIIPGFITDGLGLLLILPFIQAFIVHKILPKEKLNKMHKMNKVTPTQDGNIIEGEWQSKDVFKLLNDEDKNNN